MLSTWIICLCHQRFTDQSRPWISPDHVQVNDGKLALGKWRPRQDPGKCILEVKCWSHQRAGIRRKRVAVPAGGSLSYSTFNTKFHDRWFTLRN